VAALPPLYHEVKVDLNPEQAFELFTGRIGEWWPLAKLSVFGHGSTVAFTEDGRLLERHGEQASSWGEVTDWVPGERLGMTWHPGRPEEQASHIAVTFSAYGERTLVTLEHSGWEVYEDSIAARNEYTGGWPTVLALFAGAATDGAEDEEQAPTTWAALFFTPADGQGAAAFDDERFAGHVAFLNQMEEAGYLVAAGPMLDEDGSGMTILRLPGEDRLDEVQRLANEDESVISGLFNARVRPWRVFFAPGVARSPSGA
jgi:uncharacterized protein YciI/uncharacterized protein YndB with AHSA1/START domain